MTSADDTPRDVPVVVDRYLSISTIARRFGVSRWTIYRQIVRGAVPYERTAKGRYLVRQSVVNRFRIPRK